MLDDRIILVHPDGRTQSVQDYVKELVQGVQSRLYDGRDQAERRKNKTGGLSKPKHKVTTAIDKPEVVRFQETWIDDTDVADDVNQSGGGKGADDYKQVAARAEGACGSEQVQNDHEDGEHHGGWAFLSRLLARATTRSHGHQTDGHEDRRGIADFFRKRKSSDNTFTVEEKENEAETKHHVTPSPKKQKTRLMSDDSGIAVDIPRRDSDLRSQRLMRLRNSIRNFISCTTTGDNSSSVEPAEPSEL